MPRNKQTFQVASPAKPTDSDYIRLPEKESIPYSQQRITFSIECCNEKRFCFRKLQNKEDKVGFASRLHELSQLTWGDINQTGRKSLGYETLNNIKADGSCVPKGAPIIGFIIHDYRRMVGYRDENGMFHILWFDHNGKLYDHD